MPIYEYLCEACGERLEVLQQITDEPMRECPACHKATLKKLVSAAGFRLAGQGWYETDFKTKNQRNLASKQDAKTDSKKDVSKKTDAGSKQATGAKNSTPKQKASKAIN